MELCGENSFISEGFGGINQFQTWAFVAITELVCKGCQRTDPFPSLCPYVVQNYPLTGIKDVIFIANFYIAGLYLG